MTQWLRTVASSPIVESTMRTPACSSHRAPTRVRPCRKTPGWMTVSGPTVTSMSTYVVAGSSMVTPAAISSSFLVCRTIRLTSASSVWLLMPRTSSGSATSTVSTGRPRCR